MPCIIGIDLDRIDKLAELVSAKKLSPAEGPSLLRSNMSREEIVRYAVIAYAIDYGLGEGKHDLHEAIVERIVEGKLTADELARMDKHSLERLLVGQTGIKVRDVERRAALVRDIGVKVLALYNGEFYKLIVESKGQLDFRGRGFLSIVEDFQAYRSPARSKALRLAMILYSLGVLPLHDIWNANVVVDARMVGLAIRSGILILDEELLERIAVGLPLTLMEDSILRYGVAHVYRLVVEKVGLDPFEATRVLNTVYRELCHPDTVKSSDPSICRAAEEPLLRVKDPLPPPGAWWD